MRRGDDKIFKIRYLFLFTSYGHGIVLNQHFPCSKYISISLIGRSDVTSFMNATAGQFWIPVTRHFGTKPFRPLDVSAPRRFGPRCFGPRRFGTKLA